jgi:hypothetical protein
MESGVCAARHACVALNDSPQIGAPFFLLFPGQVDGTECAVLCCAGLQLLDRHLVSSECGGAQALGSLDSQLAETEDVLSYVSDLLSLGELRTAFFCWPQQLASVAVSCVPCWTLFGVFH